MACAMTEFEIFAVELSREAARVALPFFRGDFTQEDKGGPGAFDGMAVDVQGNLWCGFGGDGSKAADPAQLDGDRDGIGDACDDDGIRSGVPNLECKKKLKQAFAATPEWNWPGTQTLPAAGTDTETLTQRVSPH